MKWSHVGGQCRWIAVGFVLMLHVQSGASQEGEAAKGARTAEEASPADASVDVAPTAEAIAQWIADLEDDRYEVRERASQRLLAHGRSALDRIAAAADGSQAEAAARAVVILEELAENADDPKLKLAALERLVGLKNRASASRRAEEQLAAVWEEISLPIALEMGGRLDPDSIDETGRQGFGKFIIGPDWTGGDAGLVHVSRLRSLHTVSIRRAAISVEGIGRLAEMPSLRLLELYGMGLDEEEQAGLVEQFPYAKLDVRRGAMLGVRGTLQTPLAEIYSVEPGSAAAHADLRPGDVITKVDNVEVQSFAELTTEIAKHDPGNKAVLQVQRGGRTIQREVVFGQWE